MPLPHIPRYHQSNGKSAADYIYPKAIVSVSRQCGKKMPHRTTE